MKPFTLIVLMVALGSIFFSRCSRINVAGATDMPNEPSTVTATVKNASGIPVKGAAVIVVASESYAPLPGPAVNSNQKYIRTSTDESGSFSLDSLGIGSYMIEVNDHHTSALRIHYAQGLDTGKNDLGVVILRPYSAIHGKVALTEKTRPQRFVQVLGLNRLASVDSNGFFNLDSLPADSFKLHIASPDTAVAVIETALIAAKPGEIADVYAPWKFALKFIINTSASGAGTTENVQGFPLLVRLTSNNFDFSQARADGGDIRFTKSNNVDLPYHLERWDSASEVAEIWVGVDTVFGNNATQYIQMFWGNPQSQTLSNGAGVFSKENGWAGVWHLTESAPDSVTNALYVNSVEHTNFGDDRVFASDKNGCIGKGQYFQKGDRIRVARATVALKQQNVLLSAWIQTNNIDLRGSDVASMGDNYMVRINASGRAKFVLYSLLDTVEIVCEDNVINVADSAWHFLAGSYDGSEIRLYVDGVVRKSISYSGVIPYNRGPDFVIGRHGFDQPSFDFTGNIDEVECSSVVRSADWIRLLYENQKIESNVVMKK